MGLLSHVERQGQTAEQFKGVEKLETKERRELPEGDVLSGASLPDVHATEDAEHRPGDRGESQ